MQKKQKKTRAKAKNVTQTVIVNVGKKRSAPTRPTIPKPTPLQQATQFIQSAGPLIRPADSMFQSVQLMQRLIEPTTMKINQLQEAIAKLQPAKQEPQQAVPLPVKPQPLNPVVEVSLPSKPRETVLDQPDAPLVTPSKPLVPAGPPRLDDPHEDVPIREIEPEREVEYVAEEKQEASQASSSSADPYEKYYSRERLEKLNLKSGDINVRTIAKHLNIPTSYRDDLNSPRNYTKNELINSILQRLGL